MNVTSTKVENTIADESDQARPDPSANQAISFPELNEEVSGNEDTDRRLYRRSVAYFFFGFGSNKHSIMTDEP